METPQSRGNGINAALPAGVRFVDVLKEELALLVV